MKTIITLNSCQLVTVTAPVRIVSNYNTSPGFQDRRCGTQDRSEHLGSRATRSVGMRPQISINDEGSNG